MVSAWTGARQSQSSIQDAKSTVRDGVSLLLLWFVDGMSPGEANHGNAIQSYRHYVELVHTQPWSVHLRPASDYRATPSTASNQKLILHVSEMRAALARRRFPPRGENLALCMAARDLCGWKPRRRMVSVSRCETDRGALCQGLILESQICVCTCCSIAERHVSLRYQKIVEKGAF